MNGDQPRLVRWARKPGRTSAISSTSRYRLRPMAARHAMYYRDCVWEQFSEAEYKRRYAALRAKMREHKLDAVDAAGGPSHWSFPAPA